MDIEDVDVSDEEDDASPLGVMATIIETQRVPEHTTFESNARVAAKRAVTADPVPAPVQA